MDNLFEYVLSLDDKMSANLKKIGFESEYALDKFAKLQDSAVKTDKLFDVMGGSAGALRERLNVLRQERDWIPQTNIQDIRVYNSEIKKLEKQLHKLETINGSKLKTWAKDAFSNIPGIEMLNPLTSALTVLSKGGKMAAIFDEGMAKINTTAQLSDEKLAVLRKRLINVGSDAGANLATVPDAFEKILSQTGDVTLSQDILQATLKGSKAGFTDAGVVSDALARSLSLIGKENTNANEVLDTLFAAKRVGAGEFKDFSRYIPGLIASGQSLGVGFKEAAGLFAYMTGKGQSAERAAVLMENAFTALGKGDIVKAMEKEKIKIFDEKGTMLGMDKIFSQLQKKLASFGKNDKAKSSFLEKIGLKDKEAKQAFMILASDTSKLSETLKEVANSTGEADKAFEKAQNPMTKINMLWTKTQQLLLSTGDGIMTVFSPAIDGLLWLMEPLNAGFEWFFGGIRDGNPLVLSLTAGIGAYVIMTNAAVLANKVAAGATWLWGKAQALLEVILAANPVGLITIGVAALASILTYVILKTKGWGTVWSGVIGFATNYFDAFVTGIKFKWYETIDTLISTLDFFKKAWYDFKDTLHIGNDAENTAALSKIESDAKARNKHLNNLLSLQKKYDDAASASFNSINLEWDDNVSLKGVKDNIVKKTGLDKIIPTVGTNSGGGKTDILSSKNGITGSSGKSVPKNDDKVFQNIETISGGGEKHTHFNITIQKLQDDTKIFVNKADDAIEDIGDRIQEEMIKALNMINQMQTA